MTFDRKIAIRTPNEINQNIVLYLYISACVPNRVTTEIKLVIRESATDIFRPANKNSSSFFFDLLLHKIIQLLHIVPSKFRIQYSQKYGSISTYRFQSYSCRSCSTSFNFNHRIVHFLFIPRLFVS